MLVWPSPALCPHHLSHLPTALWCQLMDGGLSFHSLGPMTLESPWTPLPLTRLGSPDRPTFRMYSESEHFPSPTATSRSLPPSASVGRCSHLCPPRPQTPRVHSPCSSQRDPLEAKVRSCHPFAPAVVPIPEQSKSLYQPTGPSWSVPAAPPPPSCSPLIPAATSGFLEPPRAWKSPALCPAACRLPCCDKPPLTPYPAQPACPLTSCTLSHSAYSSISHSQDYRLVILLLGYWVFSSSALRTYAL